MTLTLSAVTVILLPPEVFSVVTAIAWEVQVLKMSALMGLALVAAIPWARTAELGTRRRMQRWSTPGFAAGLIYMVSTDPVFLVLGFCLLVKAAVDVWMERAHLASESLRIRLATRGTDRDR